MNDWAANEVIRPDYVGSVDRWSYRDLIFTRMVAWLRAKQMPRPEVAKRVARVRSGLTAGEEFLTVRSDGRALLVAGESEDRWSGQQALPGVAALLDEFDLVLDEAGSSSIWGPNLVTPSERSYISPQVLGGEPCVRDTRIPTASVFALHEERGMSIRAITSLYEELSPEDVRDALALESRLRGVALAA